MFNYILRSGLGYNETIERLSKIYRETVDSIAKMLLNPDMYMNELWGSYKKIVENQDIKTSGYAEYAIKCK